MFGYVTPDKPNMFMKDYYNYKAYYCGLCMAIGKKCGQFMRFTTSYDMTFLDMLIHSIKGIEPVYKMKACILNPLKKKSVVIGDELTKKIVDVNSLLTYFKLVDDKFDGKSVAKACARVMVVKGKYKKAKKNSVNLDECFELNYTELRRLESQNCESVDNLAAPFATMLREAVKALLKDDFNQNIGDMIYNLGRWVYFMDAIDDVDDDFKKKEFNPFLVNYQYVDRASFLKDKGEELEFLLMSAYNRIIECFKEIKLTINEGALTNILWYGLLNRTKEIFGRTTKCKKIRI